MGEQPENKTGSGLQQNIAGLLCYVLGWITGIVFLIIEKENKFVRFHAVQSIVVFGTYTLIVIILNFIPVVGWIISVILGIAAFIIWIVLMLKAYQGEMFKLPVAGDFTEKLVG